MKKNKLVMQKIVTIMSLIYICVTCCVCFYMIHTGQAHNDLIPYDLIVIPALHILVLIGSIILLFKFDYRLQFMLFQIEHFICLLTGFQSLGIFFFYASAFIIYIHTYSKKYTNKILQIFFIGHVLTILYSMKDGIAEGIIYLFASVFVLSCYLWFYEMLQSKFSCFIPSTVTENEIMKKYKPGTKLYLNEFGLTERQINFVYDFINENLSYKELSEKYFVSLSTVKKEFTDVYKLFNVTKLEELHILLLQYVVEK